MPVLDWGPKLPIESHKKVYITHYRIFRTKRTTFLLRVVANKSASNRSCQNDDVNELESPESGAGSGIGSGSGLALALALVWALALAKGMLLFHIGPIRCTDRCVNTGSVGNFVGIGLPALALATIRSFCASPKVLTGKECVTDFLCAVFVAK